MTDRFKKELKLEFRRKTDLRKILKKNDYDRIGKLFIRLVKDFTARGISPITGRRFFKYKNPKRYPGKLKPPTPINLRLTGKFIESLRSTVRMGKNPVITIGFTSKKSDKKEQGHREGAGGQPKRPIIPTEKEGFTTAIIKRVNQLLDDLIKKRS